MKNFTYLRAQSIDEARREATMPGAMLLGGGTTLIDLAKCGVVGPDKVVEITRLDGLAGVTINSDGASIGALAKDEPRCGRCWNKD